MTPQLIDVNEFMPAFVDYLQEHGLVIVDGRELESAKQARLAAQRERLLKRDAVTFKEIIDAQLLPITSKPGLQHWIDTGKILPGEVCSKGNGVRRILVSAIKRLGYA